MVFSNHKQEVVAELNNSQPQCTTIALIVCKSIHFDDDTSIYRDIQYIDTRDVPIIGSAIGNGLYWLVFSYRLSDRLVYEISSRSDIIGGQLQVY